MNRFRSPISAAVLTVVMIVAAGVSQAEAASSITAKVSAPKLLHQSPFVITFSAPVMNVDTTGAVGTDLNVSDVKNTATVYPGQAVCFDASSNPIDCGKGPVSSVQFTTKANLEAGQYYQVNLGSKIQDAATGQPLTPSETVVRAQTVFGPNQWGESYTWELISQSDTAGDSYILEDAPNATARYAFSGTSFGLWALTASNCGTAKVTITQAGAPTITQTIDTYSARDIEHEWTWPSLAPGKHLFTLTTTGFGDASSTGSWIEPDAVVVNGVENTTPIFTTTWGHPATWLGHPAGWSGTGSLGPPQSNVAEATTTLSYYGRGITIGYYAGPQSGFGRVSIDGTTWDLNENTPSYGYTTWGSAKLPLGTHQLTLYGDSGQPDIFNYRTITIH